MPRRSCLERSCWEQRCVTILYLAVNVVYALALSAADIEAMVKAPENKQGLDVVAPIAQIAAERLFGSRWSNPLSVAIGLMLLSTLSAYLLLGPRVIYAMARTGQFPSVAARLSGRAEHAGGGHLPPGGRHPRLALDRLVRADRRLCERRPVDLFDAGHELDLHPPLERGPTCRGHFGRRAIRSPRRSTSS